MLRRRVRTPLRVWVALLIGVAVLLRTQAAFAALPSDAELRISATRITADDLVQVEVVLKSEGTVSPPTGGDFTVVSRGSSTSMSFGFGHRSVERTTQFLLRPNRVGDLTIGSIAVRTETGQGASDPVRVQVLAADPNRPSQQQQQPDPNDPFAGLFPPNFPRPRMQGMPPQQPAQPPQRQQPAQAPPLPRAAQFQVANAPAPGSDAMMSPGMPATADGPLLVTFVSNATPVVGEQVLVDEVLFSPVNMVGLQVADFSEPDFDGFWFEEITEARLGGQNNALRSRLIGGRTYSSTLIRSYLLLPLRAGSRTIPPASLTLELGRARGEYASTPVTLEVSDAGGSGRVGQFGVTATVDHQRLRAGDTALYHLEATGVGIFSTLTLPTLAPIPGLRLGKPSTTHDQALGPSGWMEGRAGVTIPIVPERQGTFTIPAQRLEAYNPYTRKVETLTTTGFTLTVEGQAPIAEEAHAEEGSGTPWRDALPPLRQPDRYETSPSVTAALPGVWWAVGLPPLAILLLELFRRVREVRASGAGERRRSNAKRRALARLAEQDDVSVRVREALHLFLHDRFDLAAKGRTSAQIRSWASERLGETRAEALVGMLAEADAARYAGGSAEGLEQRAADWVKEAADAN